MKPHLLVDIKNAIYRAAYGVNKNPHENKQTSSIIIKQLTKWVTKFEPSRVIIIWDTPRSRVWRKKIYENYKNRASSDYVRDMSNEVEKSSEILRNLFKYVNYTQLSLDRMEADDLIYAAVSVIHNKSTIIVSTDSDMIQIPYYFSSCSVYDPALDEIVKVPELNPAYQKSLVGDKSDRIDGYDGIGPKRSEAILRDYNKLYEFLKTNGPQKYYLNLQLIDLSLCPNLLKNKLYVQQKLQAHNNSDKASWNKFIIESKLTGLFDQPNIYHKLTNLSE